jgi:hypothetical protein
MAQPIHSTPNTIEAIQEQLSRVDEGAQDDLLSRKLHQLKVHDKRTFDTASESGTHDNAGMRALLGDDPGDEEEDEIVDKLDTEIQHAPLLSATSFTVENRDAVPQYGLLGSHEKELLFLNTNVPFSAFICGVQGSGKSHTTACILENALIPSKQLGRLESPLSALVFSYGQFGGDGSGFSDCLAMYERLRVYPLQFLCDVCER